DLVLELAPDCEEDDRDQPRAEVLAQLREDLLTGGRAEHEVEEDDVRPPIHRRFMRLASIADRDALESRALEHSLDELEHLLVVVDDQYEVAPGLGRDGMDFFGVTRSLDRVHPLSVACSELVFTVRWWLTFSVSLIARSVA